MKAWNGEGASKALQYLDKLVSINQLPSEPHLKYTDRLKEPQRLFRQQFESSDPAHKDHVHLDVLFKLLYLRGLDQRHNNFILHSMFSQAKTIATMASCTDMMHAVQTFVNNYPQGEALSEPTVAYASKSAPLETVPRPLSAPPPKKCDLCSANFLPAQPSYRFCAPCQATRRKEFRDKGKAKALVASHLPPQSSGSFFPPHVQYQHTARLLSPQLLSTFTPEVQQLMAFQAAQGQGPPYDYASLQQDPTLSALYYGYVAHASTSRSLVPCPRELYNYAQRPEHFALKANIDRLMSVADSACTLHCTGNLSRLKCAQLIPEPILLSGIGAAAVYLTHVGYDPSIPLGHRNLYYGKNVAADLISLGYLSRTGRCAFIQDLDQVLRVYFDGELLFSAPRQANKINIMPTTVDLCFNFFFLNV